MYWFLPTPGFLFGIAMRQSGCLSKSLLFSLTISGSIHIPNIKPFSCSLEERPASPFGSLRPLAVQSPREVVSSSRSPNQPSSRTKSSIPTSLAVSARSSSFSSLKSKYVASQLFTRTGLSLSLQGPRHTFSFTNLCISWLIPFKPLSE